MEALEAIGLASNLLQFIELGFKLAEKARDIHQSSFGSTEEDASHLRITTSLEASFGRLTTSTSKSHNAQEVAIHGTASECADVARQLSQLLEKTRVKGPRTKTKVFKATIRSTWKTREKQDLITRLDHALNGLNTQLLLLTRSDIITHLDNSFEWHTLQGTQLKSISTQVSSLREDLSRNCHNTAIATDLCELLDKPRQSLIKVRQHQILESLRFDLMHAREEGISEAHEATYDWILAPEGPFATSSLESTSRRFQSWLQQNGGIFFIMGKPGAGNIVPRYTDVDVDYAPEDGPQAPFSGVTSVQVPIAAASIDMVGHFGYGVDFHTIDTMSTSKFGSAAKHSADKKRRFARAFIHMFKTTRHGQLSLEAASIIGPAIALRLPLRAVKAIKGIMGLFYDTTRDIVEEHERAAAQSEKPAQTQGRTDVLSLAVRSGTLSHADLVEEGVHMTSAGTETLIGTTTWAMHLLSRPLEAQARLREEIRAKIPSPYDKAATQSVSQADLRKLPYLNAVMNEILRFHSVNGLLWRQCASPAVLAGVPIPRGTTVTFSPWALNRDPRHWGADAPVFDPARWVAHPATGSADHAYAFATFGGGPRRCIGEGYACDQLLCVLAAYVGRYELTPLDPLGGTDDGTEIGSNFALTLFKVYEGWQLHVKKISGWQLISPTEAMNLGVCLTSFQ
ncbi:uncharacterized protein PG986_003985 [Apiospora aurea]|uniref:Uncharacterized protein n=1 Tax=Apiospora aurea TaxID=335848 RepID=A0ABR1QLA4_9PEZI